MGTKKQGLIIMFPRHTLETTTFTDPAERDQYHRLYFSGVFPPTHTIPTPFSVPIFLLQPHHQSQPRAFTREELLSLLDEGDYPSIVDDVIARRKYQ
jgi:hypothetical protein